MNLPQPPSGLLVIDKPLRLTSMTVCRGVKRRLIAGGAPKSVKVGHGGTLDPLATGVVVVLIGKATRLCDRIMAGEKRYIADIDLSRRSTTDDREGQITELSFLRPPSRDQVEQVCREFTGVIQQRPPAHSAIWIDGERAYRLARKAAPGDEPQMKARPVTIHAIDILEYAFPLLRIDVRCGKGTYIRSLARDLGAALGVAGMLDTLRRTAVGEFTIDRATPLNDLPDALTQAHLLPAPPNSPAEPRP